MEISIKTVAVVIKGLIKKSLVAPFDLTATYEERFEFPNDASLGELWAKLDLLGYLEPTFVSDRKGSRWTRFHVERSFQPYEEVEVVADRTSVGVNEIRLNESLVAFTNRRANLTFGLESGSALSFNKAPVASAQSNELVVDNSLKIWFHRTVRMPDDGKMHQLPGSLGLFPLYNAGAYLNRVPDTIRESGGVFMPIWSREALWMSFHSNSRKFALRVYVGRVNAVTGKTMNEDKILNQSRNSTQDYVVVPGQQWLDGIHVQEGTVRQFVAMPLGSGYTTEGQKTGQENYGGLQIEIIPEYRRELRKWLPDNLNTATMTAILEGDSSHYLPEFSTPLELGLQLGEKIRSYPFDPTFSRPVKIADIIELDEIKIDLRAEYGYSGRAVHGYAGRAEYGYSGRAVHGYAGRAEYGYSGRAVHGYAGRAEYGYSGRAGYGWYSLKSGHRRAFKGGHGAQLMGLAAGAKLIQDIYRDDNPPRTWNTALTRIINIHFLDPATCESITHIVPPPPPINTTDYLKSNLPFFVVEEQVDNRLEGGDFDNVKSVSTLDQEKGIFTESTFDPNKPTRCNECKIRLCDCIVRPCDHTFCNSCIKKLEKDDESTEGWQCPKCQTNVSHVAGFSAPMNLPGEESLKVNVPVSVLKVEDGRVAFRSIQTTRI